MPIRKLPLHSNGHMVTSRHRPPEVEVYDFPDLPELAEMHGRLSCADTFSCGWCGKLPKYRVEADAVYIDEACPASGGITSVIRLEVPSGKIIVGDDLRSVYDGFGNGDADYNSALGQHQVIEAFAKIGCAFGPVGNSCPGLWKTGEDTYVIGRMPYNDEDEDDDEDEDEDEPIPTPEGSIRLATVITDLWAYSIADYADWLAKGGTPEEDLGWSYTVVEVPAGTYEFTHHSNEAGFDDDADHVVYADVKRLA